ncbi:MAG: hypothetical protein WC028_12755 [Candidatus Obscuribacterales bacterium]|jgi:hypothetical protein
MAKYFEVSDGKAADLYAAVKEQDGPAAARLLEEVGSCGWSSLIQKTNQLARKQGDSRLTNTTNTIVLGSSEKYFQVNPNEQLKLFETPSRTSSAVPVPLAIVADVKCERK